MTYRVVQWATGIHGRLALRGIIDHPELELVGVRVYGDKAGTDAGQLCDRPYTGVIATASVDDIMALQPDCVVYMPMMANPDEVIALLSAGINVVTPCGWIYPKYRDTSAIDVACAQGKTTLHGTGIHPGGITEQLPLIASAYVNNVHYVRAQEFSDLRTYDAPDVVTGVMMFGQSPEAVGSSIMKDVLADGFTQSIDMVADTIGAKLDKDYRTQHSWSVATASIETPFGVLEEGTVAAQRFAWEGCVDGAPVVCAAVDWFMGNDNLEPGWDLGRERFEMEVFGDNRFQLVTEGLHDENPENADGEESALVATAMHCVNAVPSVCDAQPGIKTLLDLPMITGRVAAHLRR